MSDGLYRFYRLGCQESFNVTVRLNTDLLTLFAVGNEITQPFKLSAALRRQIVGGRFDVGGDFFDRF